MKLKQMKNKKIAVARRTEQAMESSFNFLFSDLSSLGVCVQKMKYKIT